MDKTDEQGRTVLQAVVSLIPRADVGSFEALRSFRLGQILEVDHIDPLRNAGLIDGDAMLTEKGAALAYEMVRRVDTPSSARSEPARP